MIVTAVALGLAIAGLGALGALLRYGLGVAFNSDFPTGTLAANVVASFLLAVLTRTDTDLNLVVGVGALGALSTWSSVANEAAAMAREERGQLAAAYLTLTVTSGIVAAWVGLHVARAL